MAFEQIDPVKRQRCQNHERQKQQPRLPHKAKQDWRQDHLSISGYSMGSLGTAVRYVIKPKCSRDLAMPTAFLQSENNDPSQKISIRLLDGGISGPARHHRHLQQDQACGGGKSRGSSRSTSKRDSRMRTDRISRTWSMMSTSCCSISCRSSGLRHWQGPEWPQAQSNR